VGSGARRGLRAEIAMTTAWPTGPGEGGETSTPRLAVLAALIPWSLIRIVGIMRDSVHPGVQDPEAQVDPDAWITEIWTYLKDNILPDDCAFVDQIVHLAQRDTR
jgi:hypothetical protein